MLYNILWYNISVLVYVIYIYSYNDTIDIDHLISDLMLYLGSFALMYEININI